MSGFSRSHAGTLALKTGDFSKKKSVVLVKRENGLLKPSAGHKTLEKQGEERFSKSTNFCVLLKRPIFFTKTPGFKGKGS